MHTTVTNAVFVAVFPQYRISENIIIWIKTYKRNIINILRLINSHNSNICDINRLSPAAFIFVKLMKHSRILKSRNILFNRDLVILFAFRLDFAITSLYLVEIYTGLSTRKNLFLTVFLLTFPACHHHLEQHTHTHTNTLVSLCVFCMLVLRCSRK